MPVVKTILSAKKGDKSPGPKPDPTVCGPCPECGEKMDNAGFGYCQCMNAECPRMGIKVKAGKM